MRKTIAMLMTAIMMLSIATSALLLSVGIGTGICAATNDNQYGEGAEDTKVPQLAPLNPDFVAYWENPPETSFGYIPSPVDLSHLGDIGVKSQEEKANPVMPYIEPGRIPRMPIWSEETILEDGQIRIDRGIGEETIPEKSAEEKANPVMPYIEPGRIPGMPIWSEETIPTRPTP